MRTTIAIAAAVVALTALPAAALAGGSDQGRSLDCGDLQVNPAKPKLGLPKKGAYELNSFNKRGQTPLPCAKVRAFAKAYVANGTVPSGYRVKGYPNMIGRDFYKTGTGTSAGFQIIWMK
ncbi:MAG: hypothetical protein FJW99_07865 [Actinobacteria bacterium]|nr:hypothetical protein [Actinomycetota bacterium]MBM3697512.1 hypothetical protein [Actinomycetota bacterium]